MVGAVGEMVSVKRRKLWKMGEDGLCCSSSAFQTRLGPSSVLEERSGVPIVFVLLLCCRLPPNWGRCPRYIYNMKDSSGKLPCKSLGNKSRGESAVEDSSVAQSTNLAEDRIRELISAYLMDFFLSSFCLFHGRISRINSLIDSKLSDQENVGQDAT